MYEIKLNVSRVIVLDTPFESRILEDNQACIGIMDGHSVLLVRVDAEDIKKQILNPSVNPQTLTSICLGCKKDLSWCDCK